MHELKNIGEITDWFLIGRSLSSAAKTVDVTDFQGLTNTYVNKYTPIFPLGVLYDVYGLLLNNVPEKQNIRHPGLQKAVWDYTESFLNRLYTDAKFLDLKEICAKIRHKPLLFEVAAFITNHLKDHIKYDRGVLLSPGHLRTIMPTTNNVQQRTADALKQSEQLCLDLVHDYETLVKKTRHSASLITDYVVYVAENITVLNTESKRIVAKQLADAEEKINGYLPRVFRKRRKEYGNVNTKINDDEKTFPTGGFSSITNRGSFENLVCSELMFMDNTESFDLFDVRYSEEELLYYNRDENTLSRQYKQVTFIFDPSVEKLKFRDRDLPWQRLIMLFGTVIGVVRKLVKTLNEDALKIILVFPGGTQPVEELEILKIFLHKFIASQVVDVVDYADNDLLGRGVVVRVTANTEVPKTDVVFSALSSPEIYVDGKQRMLPTTPALTRWLLAAEELVNLLV